MAASSSTAERQADFRTETRASFRHAKAAVGDLKVGQQSCEVDNKWDQKLTENKMRNASV